MRRIFLGAALIFATIPLDFACSSDEEPQDDGDSMGMNDIDPMLGVGGDKPGSGNGQACASFSGLNNCASAGKSAKKQEVQLLLLIDKSGSMEDKDGFTDSKWATMREALQESLTEARAEINVGLSLYPFPKNPLIGISSATCGNLDNCCEMPSSSEPNIPVGKGEDTVPLILDEFVKVRPGGGTPTSVALDHAYDYFVNGSGKDLKGDRYVVLATDGGPNCNSDLACEASTCTFNIEERQIDGRPMCERDGENCCTIAGDPRCLDDKASQDAIAQLHSAGIDTFVIGVPGSELYADVLDDLAVEGGRPLGGVRKYFQVDAQGGVEGLSSVFRRITEDLVTTCDIQLEEEPTSLQEVNVAVDCEVIPQNAEDGAGGAGGESAEGEKNWLVDADTSPPTIRLQGGLCERVQEGVDRVDVILGCPPVY